MKAQFFNKPLNYTLNVDGDIWKQGSSVNGDLSISNTSNEVIDLTRLGCHLCYCISKKLKAKDETGINVLQSTLFQAGEEKLHFNFELDSNIPITDSVGSLQLLTGDIDAPLTCGMMELKVSPIDAINNFIEVFELFYRFKFKALKNKKGLIEAQVSPPTTKEWAKIQKMVLQMKMDGKVLIVTCLTTIKTLSFDNSSSTKTKDEKKEIVLKMTEKEYELYGAVNQEGIKKHISILLDQIRLKPIL